MTKRSVGSVWHKSLANLPSIMVDPVFPSFLVRIKLKKMQFFARSFLISQIIRGFRAKHHTAVRQDCLHGMPRFRITFSKVTKANRFFIILNKKYLMALTNIKHNMYIDSVI